MKIALVHDQLHEFGGAERVFLVLKKIFPDAEVYTAFCSMDRLKSHALDAENWRIHESFVARIPFIRKLYSPLRFLAPKIWESFTFDKYDLVISSSGWYMCKGINTKKTTTHISYIHHPPRYLYGYETAMEWQRYWPIKIYAYIVNHFLRMWDFESTQRPNYLIANSEETKRRIAKFYRRDSIVIYPPVTIPKMLQVSHIKLQDKNYYVTVSRLQKAKHIEVLIEAANKAKFQLKIVGEGKDREYLQSISGSTVEFVGNISDAAFEKLYSGARAFLFASVDEEFGIAPIEAMGWGVPVIAYKSGGLVETVQNGINGFLYDKLSKVALLESINQLESLSTEHYKKMCQEARTEAERYSEGVFRKKINMLIQNQIIRT